MQTYAVIVKHLQYSVTFLGYNGVPKDTQINFSLTNKLKLLLLKCIEELEKIETSFIVGAIIKKYLSLKLYSLFYNIIIKLINYD